MKQFQIEYICRCSAEKSLADGFLHGSGKSVRMKDDGSSEC